MSEGAASGGGNAGGAATGAAGTEGAGGAGGAGGATASQGQQASAQAQKGAQAAGKGAPAAHAGADGKAGKEGQAAAPTAEELEEIKLGHASAKVPKEVAKIIKDMERGFHSANQERAFFRQLFNNASPQEIAAAAKDNEKFAEFLFKNRGIDTDQFSQKRLAEKLKREMMDPKDRELEDHRAFRAKAEREEQERVAKEKEGQRTREEQQEAVQVRTQIWKAIEKEPSFHNNQFLVARVVATKAQAEAQKLDWTWDDCVAKIKNDIRESTRSRASALTPEQLEEELGPEILKKWREHDLKRVTGHAPPSRAASPKDSRPGSQPVTGKDKKPLSEAEYREYFARLARGE